LDLVHTMEVVDVVPAHVHVIEGVA
jgi:hypothetical protein